MPRHVERRILPYSSTQLFDLVIDVDRYSEFLPWCVESRVHSRQDGVIDADLTIGFRSFRETFGSRVEYVRPDRIDVTPTHGPFLRMHNRWRFTDLDGNRCQVDFEIDFKFRSRILDALMGSLLYAATQRMVREFEMRAGQLYPGSRPGPSPATGNPMESS